MLKTILNKFFKLLHYILNIILKFHIFFLYLLNSYTIIFVGLGYTFTIYIYHKNLPLAASYEYISTTKNTLCKFLSQIKKENVSRET